MEQEGGGEGRANFITSERLGQAYMLFRVQFSRAGDISLCFYYLTRRRYEE